jgi:hypothetical protein
MTKARSNAVAEAAKGDLSVGSGTNLAGILAVGSNGDTLVADSSTSTGLRYNPQNALANPIINGGMDVWQRGTSVAIPASSSGYGADRWMINVPANCAVTLSRQTVSDTTNLPNIQYSQRLQRNAGQTGTGGVAFASSVETINTIPFAGKTVTMSFYARKGADFASGSVTGFLITGTGTDQNRATGGYTGENTSISAGFNFSTTWTRYVITGTIPTNATEMSTYFFYGYTGTAGANDWIEITGMQIDLGTYTASTAPSFRRSQGTIQGELAACQRYYFLEGFGKSVAQRIIGTGGYIAAGDANCVLNFPVTMRTTPSLVIATGTNFYAFISAGNALDYITSLTIINSSPTTALLYNNTETAGTAGQAAICLVLSNSGSIGFSAEL